MCRFNHQFLKTIWIIPISSNVFQIKIMPLSQEPGNLILQTYVMWWCKLACIILGENINSGQLRFNNVVQCKFMYCKVLTVLRININKFKHCLCGKNVWLFHLIFVYLFVHCWYHFCLAIMSNKNTASITVEI